MKIRGKVVKGRSLGRKLGFPTANISLGEDLKIDNGVYISAVEIDGVRYRAISNVGVKPTVGGDVRGLESHIIEFSGDLYGRCIEVELLERLREERHFESVEALRQQIEQDIERVKNLKIDIKCM